MGAMRPCQGVGEWQETETPLRRAPALDSRFRGNDDGGVRVGKCWRCWGGGPFDRLRANGIGERACDGE